MIETRLHHLVEAIASGKSTDKVFDSLNDVEARKKVVVKELPTLESRWSLMAMCWEWPVCLESLLIGFAHYGLSE